MKINIYTIGCLCLLLSGLWMCSETKSVSQETHSRLSSLSTLSDSQFIKEQREKQMLAEKYPLRSVYPEVKPIEIQDLKISLNQALIIDVRSQLEFEVIHVHNAFNILVGYMEEADLLPLRSKDGKEYLVFYCNGTTCTKSYKAAQEAINWGFKNVRVLDAGIFEWAKEYPQDTVFFDRSLTENTVNTSLISKEELDSVSLSPAEFIAKATSGEYSVFDIRDAQEKLENPITLQRKEMDLNVLHRIVKLKNVPIPKTKILFMDNVGKQVEWLHYYLKKFGFTHYYFLKGGVLQWQKDGFNPYGEKGIN